MKTLPFRSSLFLALCVLTAGCGLIAGVKDRALVEGGGGSTSSGTTSSTISASSTGGAGGQAVTSSTATGTGTGGAGGALCPPSAAGVEVLVCNEGRPSSLVLEGSLLFWASEDDGTVRSIPTVGGVVTTVAKDQMGVCGVALAAGAVYWRTKEGFVRRRSLAMPSSPIEEIAAEQGSSCAIAADGVNVYWVKVVAALNSDVIRSVMQKNLQGQSDVVTQVAQVDSLDATDPDSLYWASKGKQKVFSALKSNGATNSIGAGVAPCAARVEGSHVYWTDSGAGKIIKVTLDGTAPTTVAQNAHNPCAIAPHGNFIYWVDQLSSGTVNRVQDTFSADLVVLANNQNMPCSIAVDPEGTHVYWTTCLGGEVLRLAVNPIPN